MSRSGLRDRCEQLLSGLDIPDIFDVRTFARSLGDSRGRRLVLRPTQNLHGPCGLWIALDSTDVVFYETTTSPLHQTQIILHELGHLIAGHLSDRTLDEQLLHALMPSLNPAMVRRVLSRSGYSHAQEREAEMLATLILSRVDPATRSVTMIRRLTRPVDVLHATLGGDPRL